MDYEIVIGLEVHCQLRTVTKMFCACAYEVGGEPNTQIDPYTLGLPGTLPVPNRAAVDAALRLAIALGCEIQPRSRWARKHYFYPDLPKGYQITQFELPLCEHGHWTLSYLTAPHSTSASAAPIWKKIRGALCMKASSRW
jgi:aspartyl-tRNA(Asn)/glutamyl-tRNA(Gln) amidotransferase subunit B